MTRMRDAIDFHVISLYTSLVTARLIANCPRERRIAEATLACGASRWASRPASHRSRPC